MIRGWLWWTKHTPSQLSNWFHTLLVIAQLKNKCEIVSSFSLHITHLISPTTTPLLHKATLVGIFSIITLHPKCSRFREVFKFRRYVNTPLFSPIGTPLIALYADFTMKIPFLSSFHNNLSTISFLGVLLIIVCINCCSCTFSKLISLSSKQFSTHNYLLPIPPSPICFCS